jgi:hypothetical protein
MRTVALIGATLAVNPIRKVVTLLQEMQKEVEAEGEKETDLFEKFQCYCKGNNGNLQKQAEDAAAAGTDARAKVEAETSEKKQVDQSLAQAKKDRTEAKQDLAKATSLRAKEAAAFREANADAVANLDSTKSAITALEKGSGEAFLQTNGDRLNNIVNAHGDSLDEEDKQALVSFLSLSKDYAPQSGQIIGILKNMADEMEKDLGVAGEEEKSAQASYNDLKGAKQKEIQATTDAIESLTERSGKLAVSIVQNKNAAEDSEEEAGDAAQFLANLKQTCADKATEYETRQKVRGDELIAIGQAIGILNDDDALDLFKSTLKSPEAPAAAQRSFMQVKAKKADKLQTAKAMIAQAVNGGEGNVALALLSHTVQSALKTQAGKADFSKVNELIDNMVTLLGKEQKDDAKHRSFCNAEFDTSADSAKELKSQISALASQISQVKDEIAALGDAISASEQKVADLDKSVKEAGVQREAEHTEYQNVLQANQLAIELIGKAKNKLNKFYNPSMYVEEPQRELTAEDRAVLAAGGEVDRSIPQQPIAFLQTHSQEDESQPAPPPETFSGEYTGKGKKSNGVIALLDKLVGELESDVQDAEHEEKTANRDYQKLTKDATTSRKQEVRSIVTKSKSKADNEATLEEAKRGHQLKLAAQTELNTYVSELHQSCDFIVAQFEVRKEARTKEIEGLKRAKAVLAGADYSF